VARQTRAQRRARRAEAGDGAVQTGRPRPAQQPAVRSAAPARVEPTERHLPGSGGRRFVSESMAELKKVEWPRQNQLIQGVVVVLIACIVVGVYLWGADQVFKPLVQKVFLR
jgi:preprotein translocase subunit SecE